ncbi:MAG: hypothetical protein JST59_09725 [Actinobacteria bacterium]|nr:hypothetical protein [Actinomycetota bacterium]
MAGDRGIDEDGLRRVRKALRAATRERLLVAVPPILDVLDELDSWLADDHQWRNASPRNRVSLIDDLRAASDALGPHLREVLEVGSRSPVEELRRSRAALGDGRRPPDESLRRSLAGSVAAVRARVLADDSLKAAWSDLLSAGGPEEGASAARTLLRLAEARGHGEDSLADRLGAILGDNARRLAIERGEIPAEGDLNRPAGSGIEERLSLASAAITSIPRRGEAAVWLLYAFARRISPPVLEVGPRMTLYDVGWLRSVVETGHAAYLLPPELDRDLESIGLLLPRLDPGAREEGPLPPPGPRPKEDEEVPHVAVRIDLGEVAISEAEASARSSAEALVALADLHDAESPWVVEESFSMYVDGRHGAWSFAAPAAFAPTSAQRVAMSTDATSEVIRRNAGRWGPHLPVLDAEMREATHLLIWLRRARETWAPGRLILCDRIVERVAGWAGLSGPGRLVDEHLRLPWALGRMRAEMVDIAWSAFNAIADISDLGLEEQKRLRNAHEEIRWDHVIGFDLGVSSWRLDPQGVARRLGWLADRVPVDSAVRERIETAQRRLAAGPAAAAWASDLMREFKMIDARARRLRNTLVHGGPAIERAAGEVLPFVESIAVDALSVSIEGRFDGRDLVDVFLDRRTRAESILGELKAGADPVEALWPGRTGPGPTGS